MEKTNLCVSLALLIGLVLSLFPQDSEEAKVIFVLTHGRVKPLVNDPGKRETAVTGREKSKPEEKVDGEAEAKKRKKRKRKKARKNRQLIRWLRKQGKAIPKRLKHFLRRQKKRRRLMKTKPIAVNPKLKSIFQKLARKKTE